MNHYNYNEMYNVLARELYSDIDIARFAGELFKTVTLCEVKLLLKSHVIELQDDFNSDINGLISSLGETK